MQTTLYKVFTPFIFILFFMSGCADKNRQSLQTVDNVDVNKYLGIWYEVARYDNWFEKGCFGASAEYKLRGGDINVLNSCFDEKQIKIKDAKGIAKVVDSNNSKLKVSFFWPFYGDYWILLLADDYRYSVVGEQSRKYFWILSRTKELSKADKEFILSKMPGLGYDVNKLIWLNYN
ncbi:MAG TPA: lipocalin family protein [Campylobacterales bacterium]|nr:lipocalin family protein [Campylobacterales bacterium]